MPGGRDRTADAMRRLRVRLTLVSIAAVAVVLVVAGVLLQMTLRRQLISDVDERLADRAEEAAAVAPRIEPFDGVEELVVQLVREDSSVLATTANVADAAAIADPPSGDEEWRTIDGIADDAPYRVLSQWISVDGTPVVLHVAEEIDDIDEATDALTASLLIALPIVLGALGALTWWIVGRTLRPVAAAAVREEQFVSDAAHELRSPLARMRARLEVDRTHPDAADANATAQDTLTDVLAMQRLIDDLLVLARGDVRSEVTSAPALVGLDDIVLDEARDARDRMTGTTIDGAAVSAATVRGSSDELRRMVRNLLDNALRHAHSRVRLSLTESNGTVSFHVDDDGPGIPADQREIVFERFTRISAARTPGSAQHGLGLAIARDIVRRHGGEIEVGAAPLGGARLLVTLPSA